MKFSINKTDLERVVALAKDVVAGPRATIEILRHVLLRARTGAAELEVSGTDTTTSIKARAIASVTVPGSVALDAAKLHEIAKTAPADAIAVDVDAEHWATVTAGNARFRIAGLDPQDFPALPTPAGGSVAIAGADLLALIERSAFAIPGVDSKYSLRASELRLSKAGAQMAATDGHRLAIVKRDREIEIVDPVIALIPDEALHQLTRLASNSEDEVRFYNENENFVAFEGTDWLLASKRPTGEMMKYQRYVELIKKGIDVVVPRAQLAALLKRVRIVGTAKTEGVLLTLDRGAFRASNSTSGIGESADWLAVDHDGPELKLGINARYVLDFLSIDGPENVCVSFPKDAGESGVTPLVMKPDGDSASAFSYYVSPMRL